MRFALIICTYMRPEPCRTLLESVAAQTLYPDEILIIDGSANDQTMKVIADGNFRSVTYHKVAAEFRGLTKQRNYGIDNISGNIQVVAFLDDDTALETDYFENLIRTFENDALVTGVGGCAINENRWQPAVAGKSYKKNRYFQLDGFAYKEGQRNVIRNILGLQSPLPPGQMPDFSHGRTSGYPLNGKIYEVDLLVGMSFAFREKVFRNIKFSQYFDGYGLYEDADYSLRAKNFGKNVINTNVRLSHYHNPAGRPDKFKYGKMVVRNGWYVWRVGYPNPSLKAKFKWHAITLLLATIRLSNSIKGNNKREAFQEAVGRYAAWLNLFVNLPQINRQK